MGSKFTPELMEKAKQAGSAEELMALAKENEVALTKEEAEAYFKRLGSPGALSDEELDNVSGGGCSGFRLCPYCEYPLDQINGEWVCRACGKSFS